MENSYSAAQRVLALPELLDYILQVYPEQWYTSNTGQWTFALVAFKYMLVNKFWCSIALPYAWRKLGYGGNPCLRDLAKLASHPDRMQWYAYHVVEVRLKYGNRNAFLSEISEAASKDRSILMQQLPQLELPRLRSVYMHLRPKRGTQAEEDPRILSFLRPSVTDLKAIIEESALSGMIFRLLKVSPS